MATEIIKVPDLGMDAATIIEISVKPGDVIAEDDTLIVLESDKASMDVPASKGGTVKDIKVKEGDSVSEGDEILTLEIEGDSDSTEKAEAPAQAKSEDKPADKPAAASNSGGGDVKAVKVPDIGMDKASIIEVHVKVGDTIAEEDTLVTLESDKASMDVPSDTAGEVVSVQVKEGDDISEGSVLIEVKTAGGAAAASAPAAASEKAAAPTSSGGETREVKVPDIGMDKASVIEVHVKAGDTIAEEDTLVTLESDKASMDVPSDAAGEVKSVKVNVGDDVSEGTVLIEIITSGDSAAAPAPAAAKADSQETKAQPKAAAEPQAPTLASAHEGELTRPSKKVHAGPAVRKLAREFGVDLALVPGSGPKGRIVKDDVAAWVKKRIQEPGAATGGSGIPPIPDQDYSKFGEVEIKELSRIQQITAANMWRNWVNMPMVTQFDEADVTDTEAFRNSLKPDMEKRGVKISPLAFIVKACAAALLEFPQFNVSLMADGKRYVQKHYVNIGVAVDTPNGLIVPVIKDADKKSIWQIAEEIIDFAKRGRDGKVKADEMKGGCFSVSSLGGLGGTAFTPIVNAPEVAILGVSKNQIKPFWTGKEFVPRTFTPLSLSYDHKAVNGADAAKFTTYLTQVLADVRRLVL